MSIFEYDKEEEEQKLQATYEKIGEKRGEGKYEYAVCIVGLRHEYAQDEVDFGC